MTRPLRVVDLGNSQSVLQIPLPAHHGERPFPELLPDALAARGVPARVWNEGRLHDFVHLGLARWERDVRAHAPDALVLHYGVLEAQPWYGPRLLLRHVLRRDIAATRAAVWYRTHVVKRLWDTLAWFRERVMARWDRLHQVAPQRFRNGMSQLVRLAHVGLGAPVVVIGISPAPTRILARVPGQDRRTDRYNDILRQVVAAAGDGAAFVDVAALVNARGGADRHLVDGLHFSAEIQEAIAEEIADAIVAWYPDGAPAAPPAPTGGEAVVP